MTLTPATTVALVCKRPRLGIGKQRIAKTLGSAVALQLAEALLQCAIEDLNAWQGHKAILVAEHNDVGWAQSLAPDATIATQSEGNLGARLVDGWNALRASGERILFIGADCPLLDQHYLNRCALALETHHVVLGKAEDGGVVVMGSRDAWPSLIDLPWSTNTLGAALHHRCVEAGMRVARLPALPDVDLAEQLGTLKRSLSGDQRYARKALLSVLENITTTAYASAARA